MADLPVESSQPESNSFENDFENLNYSPQQEQTDADFGVSSTTELIEQAELPEEDLYSPTPEVISRDMSEAEPLVKLSDDPPPAEPILKPSSPPAAVMQEREEAPKAAAFKPSSPEAKPEKPSFIGTSWTKSVDPRAGGTLGSDDSDIEEGAPLAQCVVDLVYWRDVKKTGVVFGSVLVVLLSLVCYSVVSVVANLAVGAIIVTLCFRGYKAAIGAVQKTNEGHPFKQYLEVDIALPEDRVHEMADSVMKHSACCLRHMRRIFLVEDVVDSLKFLILLYLVSCVGGWFNGMTLLILGVVGVFTLPKVYETYKVQIDQYVDIGKTQVNNVVKQVQDKVPMLKKKTQ